MKKYTQTFNKYLKPNFKVFPIWAVIILSLISLPNTLHAQSSSCDSTVPFHVIDFTGNHSATKIIRSTRDGYCCNSSGTTRCVEFLITLDSMAQGIQIDVSGGTGNTFYESSCNNPTSVGSQMCLSGVGPHSITVCKPGGNAQDYVIKSIPIPHILPQDLYVRDGCPQTVTAVGFNSTNLSWTTLDTAHRKYLSCLSNCTTSVVTVGPGFPSYIDILVTGTAISACLTGTKSDTIRVHRLEPLKVKINQPDTFYLCPGTTTKNITAVGSGGKGVYNFWWASLNTNNRTVPAPAGTHIVRLVDSFSGCFVYDTVVVLNYPQPTAAFAGNDTTICSSNNIAQLNGSIQSATGGQWVGGTGRFLPDRTILNPKYIPSKAEVNAGFVNLVLATTSIYGCATRYDTVRINIDHIVPPVINGDIKACANATGNVYWVTATSGHSYNWTVLGGTITNGQNTNSITVTWGNTGPGFVRLTITNARGCQITTSLSTLSQYDFNYSSAVSATIGSDASSISSSVYTDGTGVQKLDDCGSASGLDIALNTVGINKGSFCYTAKFQRDEPDASFFNHGQFNLRIAGGTLFAELRTISATGVALHMGPYNTGYTVPNDDVFREYTFCYDSANGIARIYVDNTLIWSITGSPNRGIHWNTNNPFNIGLFMDGNCSKKPLLDYINLSVPVNILPAPAPAITGEDTVCSTTGGYAYTTPLTTGSTYSWSVTNGTIDEGATTNAVKVTWGNISAGSITVTETNIHGCVTTTVLNVVIQPRPTTLPIQH